jgi:peptide/nickel transport system substrate-binding protein
MIQWFGISWLMASVFLLSCNSPEHGRGPSPLTIGLEQPPSTLNPRYALDAGGQRLGALIFRGLTRIDANLNAQPDLAEKFEIKQQGKLWEFKIRSGLLDHGGSLITPELIAKCLDEYRLGKPASPHTTAFPTWKAL